MQRIVRDEAERQRQALYGTKSKLGRSGGAVKPQVNRNVGASLERLAKTLRHRPDLLAQAAHHGISAAALAQALRVLGNQLVNRAKGDSHKELEVLVG